MPDFWEASALFVVTFIASVLGATTGFGSAIIVLPTLVAAVGPRDAVGALTIIQIVGNGSRVFYNRGEINLEIFKWYALGALPAAALGALAFSKAHIDLITLLVGIFLLLSVLLNWLKIHWHGPLRPQNFTLIGGIFSLISALVGSAGPLMAPFFLRYGLSKGAYIGTEAICALLTHLAKIVLYGGLAVLTWSSVLIGITLSPAAVVGALIGKKIVEKMSPSGFTRIVEIAVFLMGLFIVFRSIAGEK
ncbi:MAG: sulfite exporter TauE/SafE family protein [Bdellovibrionaceae bacterium]|nr:sulfite exporter TauE/SafE family protein [Pseudobdellovibrionaceae bacterium]